MTEHFVGDEQAERLRTRASSFLTVFTRSHSLPEAIEHADEMLEDPDADPAFWSAVKQQSWARQEGRVIDVNDLLLSEPPVVGSHLGLGQRDTLV